MKRMIKFMLLMGFILGLSSSINAQMSWFKLTDFSESNSLSNLSLGQNGTIYGRSVDGWIYYLPENQQAWIPLSNIPNGAHVQKVAADPNSNKIYTTTSSWGLLYSNDLGQNWSIQNFGMNNQSTGMVHRISYLKAMENKLFVTFPLFQSDGSFHSKVFYSSNGAINYQHIIDFDSYVYDVEFLNANNNEMLVAAQNGIYHTSNIYSSNFNAIGFSDFQVLGLTRNENTIYAAVYDEVNTKIYSSSNLGSTWTLLANQPEFGIVWDIDFSQDKLFVSSVNGVYSFTSDFWLQLSSNTKSESLASNDSYVVASGTRLMGTIAQNFNANATTTINNGLNLKMDQAVFSNDNQLYLASSASNVLARFNFNDLSWVSRFTPENIDDYLIIHRINLAQDGQCLIGLNGYLLKTEDQGQNLVTIGTTETAPNDPIYNIFNAYEVHSNLHGIYVLQHLTQKTLNFTPDNGQTWSIINPASQGFSLFSIEQVHAKNQSLYLLATSMSFQDILIKSDDNGLNWQSISFPTGTTIKKLFTDNNNVLYAYANTDKIYRWSQTSWEMINLNLGNEPNKNIDIIFDDENRMYVSFSGTISPISNEGIYVENTQGNFDFIAFPNVNNVSLPLHKIGFNQANVLMGLTNSKVGNNHSGVYYFADESIMSTSNFQENFTFEMFPNPAKNLLNFHSKQGEFTQIDILDLTGSRIFSSNFKPQIDIRLFKSGIYIVNLTHKSGEIISKKLIIKK